MVTWETIREQVQKMREESGDTHFDSYDETQMLVEEYRSRGEKIVSRKSPRSMKTAIRQLLDSPEYELSNKSKIQILNQIIGDLLKLQE